MTVPADSRFQATEPLHRARSSGLLIAGAAAVLVPAWAGFDLFLVPRQARTFITLRCLCDIPILVLLWTLAKTRVGWRRPELLSCAVIAVVQAEIAWMLVRVGHHRDAYVMGFSLALFASGCVMGGRPRWTGVVVGTTWLALAVSLLTAANHMPAADLMSVSFYLVDLFGHRPDRPYPTRPTHRPRNGSSPPAGRRTGPYPRAAAAPRAAQRRGLPDWPSQPQALGPRAHRALANTPAPTVNQSPCCSSTLTGSKTSTTDTVTPAATKRSAWSPGCWHAQAPTTSLVARLGGDEFAVLLRDTEAVGAAKVGHNIRSAARNMLLRQGPITLSIGVAAAAGDEAQPDRLVRRADAQLYRAKTTRDALAV